MRDDFVGMMRKSKFLEIERFGAKGRGERERPPGLNQRFVASGHSVHHDHNVEHRFLGHTTIYYY